MICALLFADIRADWIRVVITRLRPEHINWEYRVVSKDTTVSKSKEPRNVKMQPNFISGSMAKL